MPAASPFQLIDPDGAEDEVITLPMSEIHALDFDLTYAQRLLVLGDGTFEKGVYSIAKDDSERWTMLRSSLGTGLPVDIRASDEHHYRTVIVLGLNDVWVDVQEVYDDGALSEDTLTHRIGNLEVRRSILEEWLGRRRMHKGTEK